ncbi:methyl-accepting chemotaxis protein, partial [Anaeromyxobacter oryzisoli]|uniref:methyl-accepting chemotaxis protein n=1 Tax=Anaeromyxobacter oryzisoli TaxID=2925408 RepID=UPI001F571CD7
MKNLSIGSRLGAAFAAVCLFLLAVGWIGLDRLAFMQEHAEEITRDRWVKARIAQEGADLAMELEIRMERMVLAEDGSAARKFAAEAGSVDQRLEDVIRRLEALHLSDDAARSLAEVKSAMGEYDRVQGEVVRLVEEGRRDEAVRAGDAQVQPVLQRLENGWLRVFEQQGKLMDEAAAEQDAAYAGARSLSLGLIATALILAVVVATWVTRSITVPVLGAVAAADRIAKGDLRDQVEVTSGDEVGKLQAAMRAMGEKLAEVIGEVRGGAEVLTGASQQVSATAQALSQGTGEQAASVEETTSSLEEMSASITQNAESSRQTEAMAKEGARNAEEG